MSGTTRWMLDPGPSPPRRAEVLGLLRKLRRHDLEIGVRHSGIAFDIGMLLYEHATTPDAKALSVDMISDATGYSGPTVRLVLKRLIEAKAAQPARRLGKTQLYGLTEAGLAGFHGYIQALLDFRDSTGASAADATAPAPDPRSDPKPPPARYAGARSGREAAD